MVGIRFRSPSETKKFLAMKTTWGEWFKDFKTRDTINGKFDRIAWLKIVGLPVRLWSEENFAKIAGEFGKVIEPVKILPSSQDLSLGSIYILAGKRLRINEEIPVENNHNIFTVGVMECDFD